MDENMSWRAQLAKSNINILNIDWGDDPCSADVYYEFMYHPNPGQTKWCKTWTKAGGVVTEFEDGHSEEHPITGADIAYDLKRQVLGLRKELEG